MLIKLTDDKMEGSKVPVSNQTSSLEKERKRTEESMQNFTLVSREILLLLSKWEWSAPNEKGTSKLNSDPMT